MRTDSFPRPVSDPEADGIPEYADDDSSAADDLELTREPDGPDPAALPADRDAVEAGADRFGTTAEEQRQGETLDDRLAQEVPDPALAVEPEPRPDTRNSPIAVESFDADSLTEDVDRVDPGTTLNDMEPVDPNLGSPVSMYDRPLGAGDEQPVGRLVDPDDGSLSDTEKDSVAFDAGAAGGGPSAEEAAMHEVRDL